MRMGTISFRRPQRQSLPSRFDLQVRPVSSETSLSRQTPLAAFIPNTRVDGLRTPGLEVRHVLDAHSEGMTHPQAGQPILDHPAEQALAQLQPLKLSSIGRDVTLQSAAL